MEKLRPDQDPFEKVINSAKRVLKYSCMLLTAYESIDGADIVGRALKIENYWLTGLGMILAVGGVTVFKMALDLQIGSNENVQK